MTPNEFFTWFEAQLKLLAWPGGANLVFGTNGVIVSPNFPNEQITRLLYPAIIVNDGGGDTDPENTLLFNQTIEALIFVDQRNDVYGRGALMGGNRPDGTASPGAGLHQIETVLLREFRNKQKNDGVIVKFVWSGAAGPVPLQETGTLVYRAYRFKTRVHLYD